MATQQCSLESYDVPSDWPAAADDALEAVYKVSEVDPRNGKESKYTSARPIPYSNQDESSSKEEVEDWAALSDEYEPTVRPKSLESVAIHETKHTDCCQSFDWKEDDGWVVEFD